MNRSDNHRCYRIYSIPTYHIVGTHHLFYQEAHLLDDALLGESRRFLLRDDLDVGRWYLSYNSRVIHRRISKEELQ